MKNALMYASVASMIYQFNMRNIRLLLDLGFQVDVACNMEKGSSITDEKIAAMKQQLEELGVRIFHVPVPRRVTDVGAIIQSISKTCTLINENKYDLIHCHSPIGSVTCRIAHRLSKWYGTTKIIYTAHGFHFYKGAPLKNWLIFYPMEFLCARYTDVLITINKEDYALGKAKMPVKQVVYIPGVGVDTQKFKDVGIACSSKCDEIGLMKDDFMMLSVGELIDRKNHSVVVRALARLENDKIKYVICGKGPNEKKLKDLAEKLGVADQLLLLGFRSDIAELMQLADVYVFPSLQEGLPVALMEAMSANKAVICSRIRGNTDLIQDSIGGLLVDPLDVDGYFKAIQQLFLDKSMRSAMGAHNCKVIKRFDKISVDAEMKRIYSEI